MTTKRPQRHGLKKPWWTMALVAVGTALFVLIALNFAPPEKHIDIAPQRLYSLDDPQFKRALGSLLGPPILGGNRVETLRNGDEIFPSMLAAIRSARSNIDFETY